MAAANPSRDLERSASPLTPLGEVLFSLAEELERARTLGLRVEGAICGVAIRSAIDGSVVSELQQLDAILQHIAALRDYATVLASHCDPSFAVDTAPALARITLAELRARLGNGALVDDPNDHWEML